MDLILTRTEFREDGIFGKITSYDGSFKCVTIEHAYAINGHGFSPKIPKGTYVCARGTHQLEHGPKFIAFEIMNVPGHTGCLFHIGNFNADSDGCVCVGESVVTGSEDGVQVISHSGDTFKRFMEAQEGLNEFTLVVI